MSNQEVTIASPGAEPAPVLAALSAAERRCVAHGVRLTAQRRAVLAALLAAPRPFGAYELIDRLARAGEKRLAPVAIYRALDFLREQGLVHRLESRNAFVACPHHHAHHEPVVFLICEECGAVGEATSAVLQDCLMALARAQGFVPRGQVIELAGLCRGCAGTGPADRTTLTDRHDHHSGPVHHDHDHDHPHPAPQDRSSSR